MADINQNISDALSRVYQVLKFSPETIKTTLGELGATQQIAIFTELVDVLTEKEAADLAAAAEKSDEEKKGVMEKIAKARVNDEGFKSAARAAAKKVIDEHIAYLKTRGDEVQKAEIAKILAEIE